MKNISGFYTLNYMNILIVALFLITAIFLIPFIFYFNVIYKNLIEVSNLNISFYYVIDQLFDAISSLTSMRIIFRFEYNDEPYNYYSISGSSCDFFDFSRSLVLSIQTAMEKNCGH